VETVIYYRLALCLLGPRVEGSGEGASALLQGEVDDHGRAAGRSRLGARGPIVRRNGTAKRHVHVGVGVDETWHYELARCVNGLGAVRVQLCGDGDYLLVFDEHVGPVTALGRDDGPAGEKKPAHSVLLSLGSGVLANSRTPRAFASIVDPGYLHGRQ
jgi:hypothetical protein